MTRSEAIEAACRTLAQYDGHNPDAAVVVGASLVLVAGKQVALVFGEPRPLWTVYVPTVESAIKVLGAVIAEPAA